MSSSTITERVNQVRDVMRSEGLQGLLIRGTDRFLNEYVPQDESTRVWITGFTGSTGDAYLTLDRAWLSVDGRYYIQADAQTAGTPFEVDRVPLGTSVSQAVLKLVRESTASGVARVGYEPDRFSVRDLGALAKSLSNSGVELVAQKPSPLERVRGPVHETNDPVRVVRDEAAGRSVAEKVELARETLEKKELDAFVIQRLDELAYLTNLRGEDLPYQATFRGVGLLRREEVVLGTEAGRLPDLGDAPIRVVSPTEWLATVRAEHRVGYDPSGSTTDVVADLEERGAIPVALTSPLTAMKAKKTGAELRVMREAFGRADRVVEQAIAFVNDRIDTGKRVTEADLADEVRRLFLESGAVGLSFKVIAAAGANGAIIHYSIPDPDREIQPGEMVLLDTGGYYQEGYATDLTRTFLAGSNEKVARAKPDQQRMFTLVLKAAIAGMSARLPEGAHGVQLDALVRAPLWAEGEDFLHGTGHGVGINVHEAPPRVSTRGYLAIEEGHVFSIEPGLYKPGVGGVRIENLCTVIASRAAPGYVDVVPLTYAAIDPRLIDESLLTGREKRWLRDYIGEREEHLETSHWESKKSSSTEETKS